ncbi:MAG: hypothetical protein ACLSWY_02605 [Ruthenibacterium lactatiformans]
MVTPLAAVRDRLEAAGIRRSRPRSFYAATGQDARLSGGAPLSALNRRSWTHCVKTCARFPLQYLCGEWDFLDRR